MAVSIERRVFTASEYERMGQAGILNEDDRVELIEGEIITMSPIGSRHTACVKRLNRLLNTALQQTIVIGIQDPIYLDEHSEPQPDVSLLRPRPDLYASGHPTSKDVLLLIEVAESSLAYDRDAKIPLYARALIPEVWLVDPEHEIIWQYTAPANGAYQQVQSAPRGQSLAATALPNLTLAVEAIIS